MKSVKRNSGRRQGCCFMQRSDKGHMRATCCGGWGTHQVDWKRWQRVCNRTQRQWPAHPSLCQPVGAGLYLSTCNSPWKRWRGSLVGFLHVAAGWENFVHLTAIGWLVKSLLCWKSQWVGALQLWLTTIPVMLNKTAHTEPWPQCCL